MKRRKPKKGISSLPLSLVENPFVSEAQKGWMYANKPEMAKEWQAHTPKGKKLPKRVSNLKKRLACNRKHIIHNAVNPSKLDPTRTLGLRRAFFQELRKRFARLKGKIVALVLKEDAFGLKPTGDTLSHFSNFTPVSNCQPGQIRGSDGRCGPGISISIPRDEMPQIKSDDLQSFITYAQIKGVDTYSGRVVVSTLAPTQSEFRQERVDNLPDEALKQPILISNDDYILDGTHRWIKAWQKDKDSIIRVTVIDLPLQESLDLMRSFPKTVYAENTRWAFQSDPQKLRAFQSWLDAQIKTELTDDTGKAAWDAYIQTGYRRGAGRAFDDTNKRNQALTSSDQRKLDSSMYSSTGEAFYSGTRDQFLRDSFAQPITREKVELLAQRAFDEMTNVTADMSNKISRTLTDGLIEGKSPYDVADDLTEQVDISATKAKRIANTEIIRVHAEGQLTALEMLGVEEVGVAVEWSVSGLNTFDKRGNPISPCARCKAMEGVVLKIDEARGMIPLHPECKCAWLPANVGEDDGDQKSSKEEIEAAAQDADIELEVDGDRPESIVGNLFNAFCPTGAGGGVDPSCSPHTADSLSTTPIKKLREIAQGIGVDHTGDRNAVIPRILGKQGGGMKSVGVPPEEPHTEGATRRVVETKPTTSFDKQRSAHSLTKSTERLGQDNYNLVHLGDLRSAHPELSKDQFDQALKHAQSTGKISLTPAEGRHGVDERDKNSAVYEHDETTGESTRMILYASVRNILSPYVDNVFCPKGKGGGVDPTCKKPEGSTVSNPHERDPDKAPIPKSFKEPPPKRPRREDEPLRPAGKDAQGKQGDLAENCATEFGFRDIIGVDPKTGEKRRSFTPREVEEYGSSIDLEYDHSGKLYELKMCKTNSTEYRLKAKLDEKEAKMRFAKNVKATPYTLVGVHDVDKGEIHFYASKEPGLTGAEVNPNSFHYLGKTKFPKS